MRIPGTRPAALDLNTRSMVHDYEQLPAEKKEELAKLNAACKDFESIFVFQLMKEMRKTVNKAKLIHGGFAEEVFTDMLDQERSRSYSLGIGNILFKQLSQAIVPPPRRR